MKGDDNMGADLYFVEKNVNKHNGALAQNILSEIIDVIDDDKPFKEQRIEKLVDKYQKGKHRV